MKINNMKNLNKKNKNNILLKAIALSSPFLVAPTVISCSYNIKEGDISAGEQQEILNSENAKKSVFDNWLTSLFTTLYAETFFNGNESQRAELEHFITYLKWSPESNKDKPGFIEDNEKIKFENAIYDAYKFYVTYRSSISTGEADSSDSSSISSNTNTYFDRKAQEWKKALYTTIDGESLINLDPNIGVLETKDDWNQDNNFKLMFKAHGTEIYANVLKLLVGQMYFLHANEKLIKNGTDYNKQTQNSYTLEYLNATSFDIKDRFYNLNKYLIIKNPQFKWSFSSEENSISNIENYIDFNNLMGSTKKTMNPLLTPYSSDKFNNGSELSLSLLRGFIALEFNSTVVEGDLSNSEDAIKLFGYQKSGLLNNDNKLLYSFENLNTRQKIAQLVQSGQELGLPMVKIKEASLTKNIKGITLNDFDLSFKAKVVDGSKILEAGDALKQKWEIIKLGFKPQTATSSKENQTVTLNMKYSFEDTGKIYEYYYSFDVVWNKSKVQSNIFQTSEYWFNSSNTDFAKLFPTYINSQIEGKTNFSYVLRPLPIFENSGTTTIGSTTYMQGKYSLENTIWSSLIDLKTGVSQNDDKPKKNLVNWFILNDTNLWTSIQDFYLFNNYDVESDNSSLSSIISSLGLTKKTDANRREAGILY